MGKYIQQGNEYDHIKSCIDHFPPGQAMGILLVGPPGCGKTLCAQSLAEDFGAPYHIIDGSPQLDRRDIEGCWEIKNGNTEFNYGPLPKSFFDANDNKIAFLIFNEPNAVKPPEQISFNAALSESHINLMSLSSERIQLNPDSKLVLIGTMNLSVIGINPLQEAFADRFLMCFDFEYPNKKKEIEIIKKITNCPKGLAEIIVEAAQQMRKMAMEDHTISSIFSTRMAVNFAVMVTHMKRFFLKENIHSMIINKISNERREIKALEIMLDGIDFQSRIHNLWS